MRHVILLMILPFVMVDNANAQTAKDALKEFGLIGTWSQDCRKAPDIIGITRLTYSIPWFGNTNIKLQSLNYYADADIESVSRITENMLKYTFTYTSSGYLLGGALTVPNGSWEMVIEKIGYVIRVFSFRSSDGKIVYVDNGAKKEKQNIFPDGPFEKCLK